MNCLFCKIIQKEIPTPFIFEDENCVAFRDINPQASTHVLIIPKKHVEKLADTTSEDKNLLGHLLNIATNVAKKEKITDYRLVINNGAEAGQSVWHLHLHLLGGRLFSLHPG